MLNLQVASELINPGYTMMLFGLERIKLVLEKLANPQDKYQVIHITGTNGKGSTATFIETGLVHAGFKVGKFTSPYIYQINESICLNQQLISDAELEQHFFIVKAVLEQYQVKLSPFEYLVVIMFSYFALNQVDYLVLEVGMGGTNDATNVVKPLFSIITNVALEHTKWLGSTLSAIANEKAGIVKANRTIIADNSCELLDAIKQRTNNYVNVLAKYSPEISLHLNHNESSLKRSSLEASTYTRLAFKNMVFNLSLLGKFQAYNFLCAYEVFQALNIPLASIHYAASESKWPGRLQIVSHNPLVVIDATHNSAGAKSLYESIKEFYPANEVVIVTSILADKDIEEMLTIFSQLATTVIYTSVTTTSRGLCAKELAKLGQDKFITEYIEEKPNQALALAKTLSKKMVIVTGSIYLLACLNIS